MKKKLRREMKTRLKDRRCWGRRWWHRVRNTHACLLRSQRILMLLPPVLHIINSTWRYLLAFICVCLPMCALCLVRWPSIRTWFWCSCGSSLHFHANDAHVCLCERWRLARRRNGSLDSRLRLLTTESSEWSDTHVALPSTSSVRI